MSKKIFTHLSEKCYRSLPASFKAPKVYLFETSLGMFKYWYPKSYRSVLMKMADHIATPGYASACKNGGYYQNIYDQPSIKHFTKCRIFGLATRPHVSITTEGLSYRDFTFTVYHEMAHIIYDTKDEVVANSFALLYNNKLWNRSV